jgi:uroporphyrinogen decarboxylase
MPASQSTKAMLQALDGIVLRKPPFWLMRQAGRYLPEYRELREYAKNFLEFCYTPDLAVEASLQPIRRYHMDAAILFSDILVIPDALGQAVEFRESEGPVLDPIRTDADLKKLNPGHVLDHLHPVFETIRRLAREIPASAALIGFAGSPWTVAVYMVEGRGGSDCRRIKDWARQAPTGLQTLIDLLVEATAEYLAEQARNGAEVIQLFDSWAGIFAQPKDAAGFRRWVIEPTRRIVELLAETCPGVPVIGFPRGAGDLAKDYAAATGIRGIGLDSETPLDWIAESLQPIATVQGNLSNRTLVAGGAAMERDATRILETLGGGPFIFNLGHGVLPETPPDHVARLCELVRNWRGPADATKESAAR